MTTVKPGFYHGDKFIGESCTDAMKWMRDNLNHGEIARFLASYIMIDDCIFESLPGHFEYILDHDIWALVESCLEFMDSSCDSHCSMIRYVTGNQEVIE